MNRMQYWSLSALLLTSVGCNKDDDVGGGGSPDDDSSASLDSLAGDSAGDTGSNGNGPGGGGGDVEICNGLDDDGDGRVDNGMLNLRWDSSIRAHDWATGSGLMEFIYTVQMDSDMNGTFDYSSTSSYK